MERAAIQVSDDGLRHRVQVGDVIDFEIEDIVPFGVETGQAVRFDGMFHPVASNLTMAEARRSRINAFGIQSEGKTGLSNRSSPGPRRCLIAQAEERARRRIGRILACTGPKYSPDALFTRRLPDGSRTADEIRGGPSPRSSQARVSSGEDGTSLYSDNRELTIGRFRTVSSSALTRTTATVARDS